MGKALAVSPLAPATQPLLSPLAGVKLATCAAGIRYQGRTDLLLVELAAETSVAGVLTTSLTRSAPVDWCRNGLQGGRARGLLVNSGNSNAFTGKAGYNAMQRSLEAAASMLNCTKEEVFVASTGVIGEVLNDAKLTAVLPALQQSLDANGWAEAARAIMTTDTFPKAATRQIDVAGKTVTLHGIAKGSGMIAPDMATMLAFLFTDAAIEPALLQSMLTQANTQSFNCMTVDGDTSTSDTCLLFATGQGATITKTEAALFQHALTELMIELAQLVAKDGEGASKFITIRVTGAESQEAARKVGLSIGNSPLVKTAIAGEDANWGRIVMAVGKSGQRAERDLLTVKMGGVVMARNGQLEPGYDETPVREHLQGQDILIEVDLGLGSCEATVWTCDLTHGYITINADYRS